MTFSNQNLKYLNRYRIEMLFTQNIKYQLSSLLVNQLKVKLFITVKLYCAILDAKILNAMKENLIQL